MIIYGPIARLGLRSPSSAGPLSSTTYCCTTTKGIAKLAALQIPKFFNILDIRPCEIQILEPVIALRKWARAEALRSNEFQKESTKTLTQKSSTLATDDPRISFTTLFDRYSSWCICHSFLNVVQFQNASRVQRSSAIF